MRASAEPLRTYLPDFRLFTLVILLTAAGLVTIYSASYARAAKDLAAEAGRPAARALDEDDDTPRTAAQIQRAVSGQQAVLRKQLKWAWIGLLGLLVALYVPYEAIRSKTFVYGLLGVTLALLVLVLIIGSDHGRACRRWLHLGPVQLQPSELGKFALVIYLAHILAEVRGLIRQPEIFLKAVWPVAAVGLLVVKEPHLGATLVILGAAVAVLWLGGVERRHLALVAGLCVLVGVISVQGHGYQGGRLKVWLHPERFEVLGYQTVHCGTALARGGVAGRGIGRSIEKFYYLPECYTDSVVAVVGEETGLLGCLALLGMFVGYAACGLRVAWRCPDRFGKLLATGITAVIFLQAMLNFGVTSGLLPQTGVGMPFISYGGSSLCCFMAASGLLLNVSRLCPPVSRAERRRLARAGAGVWGA